MHWLHWFCFYSLLFYYTFNIVFPIPPILKKIILVRRAVLSVYPPYIQCSGYLLILQFTFGSHIVAGRRVWCSVQLKQPCSASHFPPRLLDIILLCVSWTGSSSVTAPSNIQQPTTTRFHSGSVSCSLFFHKFGRPRHGLLYCICISISTFSPLI